MIPLAREREREQETEREREREREKERERERAREQERERAREWPFISKNDHFDTSAPMSLGAGPFSVLPNLTRAACMSENDGLNCGCCFHVATMISHNGAGAGWGGGLLLNIFATSLKLSASAYVYIYVCVCVSIYRWNNCHRTAGARWYQ